MPTIIGICVLIAFFGHALHSRFKESNPKLAFRIGVSCMLAICFILLINSEGAVKDLQAYAIGLMK